MFFIQNNMSLHLQDKSFLFFKKKAEEIKNKYVFLPFEEINKQFLFFIC